MTTLPFSALLRSHRMSLGCSQNELARRAGCDVAYVHRMERAQDPAVPRRGVALALSVALGLDDAETDRFLYSAGLAPHEDWQSRAEVAEGRLEMLRGVFEVPSELLKFRRRTG